MHIKLMSEGRQSQVVLLDGFRLDILIKPKLYAGELLDMVASHFNLKEKEYFGISYIDDTGHHNWLQLERRVLEHEFPRRPSQTPLLLFFRVKYFVESITHLRDSATVEGFYLQAQALVYQGSIEVTSDQAFHLAALVLQAAHGDYLDDETTKQNLKQQNVIPTSTLLEHPSLPICEKRVIEKYQAVAGLSRGNAIVSYMRVVESLPTYGVHYYEVKDKSDIPWWLGISFKGVCQYDLADKKVPRKVFLWKQLENLYFRDRKFSIEVHDPKRPVSTRRSFGAGNISVYVWFAVSPALTKCIWSMAIAQHQFYLDRKHNKVIVPSPRSLNEIAAELTHDAICSNSITDTTSLARTGSTHSLPALKINGDWCEEKSPETIEMLVELQARKEALEEMLHNRSEELKRLCLQESELTGLLPPEMPLSPGERIPLTRRKGGSEFSLQERLSWRRKTKEEEEMLQLELQHVIQSKIVKASAKLVADPSSKKNSRRQHKLNYQKAQIKLKEIERKLKPLKKRIEKAIKEQLKQYSDDEPSEDSVSHSTDENDHFFREMDTNYSSHSISSERSKGSLDDIISTSSVVTVLQSPSSSSVPSSPMKSRQVSLHHSTPEKSVMSNRSSLLSDKLGYMPNSVYQTQTSYRSQQYPTLPSRLPTSVSAGAVLEHCKRKSVPSSERNSTAMPNLMSPYQNKFESTLDIDGSNLYSVPTQRTSQAFDTQDDILAALPNTQQDLGLISRHNSLDRRRRQSIQKQRYMEHKLSTGATTLMSSDINHFPPYETYQPHTSLSSQTQQVVHQPHPSHLHHLNYNASNCDSNFENKPQMQYQIPISHHDYNTSYSNNYSFANCSSQSFQIPMLNDNPVYYADEQHQNYNTVSLCSNCSKPYQYCDHTGHDLYASPYMYNKKHSVSENRHYSSTASTSPCSSDMHLPSGRDHHLNVQRSRSIYGQDESFEQVNPSKSKVEISVVRYGHIQPYWEETKPYEISDFYKYSKKHRKQTPQTNNFKELPLKTAEDKHPLLPSPQPTSPMGSENFGVADIGLHSPSVEVPVCSEHDGIQNDVVIDNGTNRIAGNSIQDKASDRYAKFERIKKTTLV